MYDFYMGKILLPIAPQKLQLKINNSNKTYTLINEDEINVLKAPGLTEISFEILLPNAKYGFAKYKSGYKPAEYFLENFEQKKQKKQAFQFIVTRQFPNGELIYGTNIKVAIEDYTITESAEDGFDTVVSMKLKQYKEYGTKKVTVDGDKASVNKERGKSENAPSSKKYKVKAGDSLWKISASQLGNGARWNEIYNLNKSVIGSNPNLIYAGQILIMP